MLWRGRVVTKSFLFSFDRSCRFLEIRFIDPAHRRNEGSFFLLVCLHTCWWLPRFWCGGFLLWVWYRDVSRYHRQSWADNPVPNNKNTECTTVLLLSFSLILSLFCRRSPVSSGCRKQTVWLSRCFILSLALQRWRPIQDRFWEPPDSAARYRYSCS